MIRDRAEVLIHS